MLSSTVISIRLVISNTFRLGWIYETADVSDPHLALFISNSASERPTSLLIGRHRSSCHFCRLLYAFGTNIYHYAHEGDHLVSCYPRLILLLSWFFSHQRFNLKGKLNISQFIKLWSSVKHTIQYVTWSDGGFDLAYCPSFVKPVCDSNGLPVFLGTPQDLKPSLLQLRFENGARLGWYDERAEILSQSSISAAAFAQRANCMRDAEGFRL